MKEIIVKKHIILFLVVVVFMSGCDKSNSNLQLVQKINNINDKVLSLEKELRYLRENVAYINSNIDRFQDAFIKPGDIGYVPIQTNLGILTLSLQNVVPYANGSKITLKLGNILSVTVSSFKCTIDYGTMDLTGGPLVEESRTKEVTLSKDLKSGYWNYIDIILEEMVPEKLGWIQIRNMQLTQLKLLL